jgi:hypothetical protein
MTCQSLPFIFNNLQVSRGYKSPHLSALYRDDSLSSFITNTLVKGGTSNQVHDEGCRIQDADSGGSGRACAAKT